MNPFPTLLRFAAIPVMVCSLVHADVTVSNVRSVQRAGTKLVDIDYNLSGSTPPFNVSVRVSSDDGVTFTVPVTSLSGAFGAGQAAGTNKRITWNAGVNWNGKYTPNMRFEVTATDTVTPPVASGFVLIPAGTFQMGDELDGMADASVHTVNVSAFYMAKYETTKELWDEVRAWGLTHNYTDLAVGNGSFASKGANHPVHSITWYDMVKWCNARSEKENLTPCYTVSGAVYRTGSSAPVCNWGANGYRLPTEAEWEKAARGGVSGKLFPWGTDTITHSQANYYSSTSYAYDTSPTRGVHPTYAVGRAPYTSPVDSFTPNAYGLHNMSGNVWELCWDWYASYTADSQTDPRGATSGSLRVVRGGGWDFDANGCRVAFRYYGYDPANSYNSIGFRVARSSVP